ncbi:hypothetical protein ACHAXS_011965, partial [Conticribra weissflogii]
DTFGVDSAQVGVLKKPNKIRLRGLLKRQHSGSLKTKIALEVLGDLANETLEGKLTDQEIGRLLVATDLSEGHGSWTITVGLFNASSSGCGLAGGLSGELLAGCFSSSGFAGGLLGASHCC